MNALIFGWDSEVSEDEDSVPEVPPLPRLRSPPKLLDLAIVRLADMYKNLQFVCVNEQKEPQRKMMKKSPIYKLAHNYIKKLDESTDHIKTKFIKEFIRKENVNACLMYHKPSPSYKCEHCYSSFYLMEQWETWHKPIFRCDRNLLAQIIIRHVNHSSETFNSFTFNIINDIEVNLRHYCHKLDKGRET